MLLQFKVSMIKLWDHSRFSDPETYTSAHYTVICSHLLVVLETLVHCTLKESVLVDWPLIILYSVERILNKMIWPSMTSAADRLVDVTCFMNEDQ